MCLIDDKRSSTSVLAEASGVSGAGPADHRSDLHPQTHPGPTQTAAAAVRGPRPGLPG